MSTKFEMKGLDELRAALRQLPEEMGQEANAIVVSHAEEAQQRVQQVYPIGPTRKNRPSGNLRKMVTVSRRDFRYGTKALVRSGAPHSHLYERGTEGRKRETLGKKSLPRGINRGVMPEAPEDKAAIPIFIRMRRKMVSALVDLVRRAGFEATES